MRKKNKKRRGKEEIKGSGRDCGEKEGLETPRGGITFVATSERCVTKRGKLQGRELEKEGDV